MLASESALQFGHDTIQLNVEIQEYKLVRLMAVIAVCATLVWRSALSMFRVIHILQDAYGYHSVRANGSVWQK